MKLEKRGEVTPEEAAAAARNTTQANGKRKPVLLYLVILFAIAFLLILYSFAMNQHSNAKTIRDLQSQVDTLQQLKDVEKQYNEALEENAALQQQIDDLERQAAVDSRTIQALNLVWKLERLYTGGENEACLQVIEALKQDDLYRALPDTAKIGEDGVAYESPRAAFDRIDEALNGSSAEE